MTERETASTDYATEDYSSGYTPGWDVAFLLFAAVIMVIVGLFHFFAGLAALIENEYLVVEDGYAYEVDITLWGIGHIILGALVAAAGAMLLSERTWALMVALLIASVSALGSFLSIPNEAGWSIVILALDIGVIWAITNQLRYNRAAGRPLPSLPSR